MPVCGHPKYADCAHEASKALNDLDVIDLRDK